MNFKLARIYFPITDFHTPKNKVAMASDNYYPSILSGEIILSEDGHKAYKIIKKVRIVTQSILFQSKKSFQAEHFLLIKSCS